MVDISETIGYNIFIQACRKEKYMARNNQLTRAFKLNLSEELRAKVDKMLEAGINVSQVIRNYLASYPIEEATKILNQ